MPQIQANFNKLDQMSELVMRKLNGGNITKDSPWDSREIRLHVENALNNKLLFDIRENMGETMETIGQYIVTFTNVGVQWDNARKVSYVDMPARYISLPRNRGLFSIGSMTDQTNKYIPIMAGGSNFNTTDTPLLQGKIGYEPQGNQAIFTTDLTNGGADLNVKVMVQLVIAADGDKFKVFVPANIEAEVIDYVYQSMANKKPEDKINDNNEVV